MTNKTKQDQEIAGGANQTKAPEEDHSAIVQCNGYRRWARKGSDAKWRDMHGTLLDVLQVVAEF